MAIEDIIGFAKGFGRGLIPFAKSNKYVIGFEGIPEPNADLSLSEEFGFYFGRTLVFSAVLVGALYGAYQNRDKSEYRNQQFFEERLDDKDLFAKRP